MTFNSFNCTFVPSPYKTEGDSCSAIVVGEETVLKDVINIKLFFTPRKYHYSVETKGRRGRMVSLPFWSETQRHFVIISILFKTHCSSRINVVYIIAVVREFPEKIRVCCSRFIDSVGVFLYEFELKNSKQKSKGTLARFKFLDFDLFSKYILQSSFWKNGNGTIIFFTTFLIHRRIKKNYTRYFLYYKVFVLIKSIAAGPFIPLLLQQKAVIKHQRNSLLFLLLLFSWMADHQYVSWMAFLEKSDQTLHITWLMTFFFLNSQVVFKVYTVVKDSLYILQWNYCIVVLLLHTLHFISNGFCKMLKNTFTFS